MKCDVKVTGIKNLQNKLNKLDRLNQPTYIKKILRKLAEIGISRCDVVYQQANFDNAPKVYDFSLQWETDTCLSLCVNGTQITFLEFGTGVTYNGGNMRNYPRADELGMVIGGYGKGHGKDKHWFYPRVNNPNGQAKIIDKQKGIYSNKWNYTEGTPAAKGMYEASKEMKSKIVEVIREVLK